MSKHTKGPWSVQGDTYVTVNSLIITHCKQAGNTTLEEAQANARLIAAAPELLEALELCLEAIQPYYDSDDDGSMEAAASNAALAAINKAKGE